MNKRQWLVKSNEKIYGPYTKNEVEESLLRRDFVIIDEITAPMEMWKLIRDHESFSKIVKNLVIEEINLLESTKVLHNDNEGLTKTLSISSTPLSKGGRSKGRDGDTDSHSIEEASDEYIYDRTPSARHRNRILSLSLSLAFIVSLGLIIYLKTLSLSENQVEKYSILLTQGGDFIHHGKFDKALSVYQDAYHLDSRPSDFHIHFAALLVQSGETVLARRVLDKLSASTLEVGSEIQLILGMADLVDGNAQDAQKRFQNVTSSHLLISARANEALSLFQSKQYLQAYELLSKIISKYKNSPLLSVLLLESKIYLWSEYRDEDYLKQIIFDVGTTKDLLDKSIYYQESLLMSAYLNILMGKPEGVAQLIRETLSVNPYQTMSFKKNIFVPEIFMNQSLWEGWCPSLINAFASDGISLAQMLLSYCEFKSGRREQGIGGMEGAVTEYHEDTLALSLYAFMLSESSSEKPALEELKKALSINPRP